MTALFHRGTPQDIGGTLAAYGVLSLRTLYAERTPYARCERHTHVCGAPRRTPAPTTWAHPRAGLRTSDPLPPTGPPAEPREAARAKLQRTDALELPTQVEAPMPMPFSKRRTLAAAALAAVTLMLGATTATADPTPNADVGTDTGAHAKGTAIASPGTGTGNLVQAPVHAHVNICGNSIAAVGALNPTQANTCEPN
ncbi:DUF320 domain-containing protein [Streptomyces sp. BG9H]|uniref:DUF320 domain-containing protein n=2 Tax=Streptomyces anatolicus TaxID=2675858 RepID=A0ABS6YPH5_9ACTN|nr:DUF320 domain-containing protein [Streptomyces anatolicus]